MRTFRGQALLALFAGGIFFTCLGDSSLWDRDEPRNAGCAVEMLARGDWVTPFFNGQIRGHKPVLLYWFMMTAYHVFGVNEFAARFWSAALAVGTVLLTYQLGRRLFNHRIGLWAGAILSTCLMFNVAGRAATPDSVLIFFTTLATLAYVTWGFAKKENNEEKEFGNTIVAESTNYFPRSWIKAAAIYGLMGLAVLAKGPVGLVLPTAVIGMFLLIVWLPQRVGDEPEKFNLYRHGLRRAAALLRPFAPAHFLRTCWQMRPLTAIAMVLLVAGPWYVWVGLRTEGRWLSDFFLEHNFGRATQSMEGHHGSFLFYPLTILIGFFPWSVFAAPLILDLIARLRIPAHDQKAGHQQTGNPHSGHRHAYLFAICWVGVYVALFTVAKTKLPSYITPCYPALAVLCGAFMHHWMEDRLLSPLVWRRIALTALGLVGGVILIALPIAAHRFLPGEEGIAILLGLIPLTGAAATGFFLNRRQPYRASGVFLTMSAAMMLGLFAVAAVRVSEHQQFRRLLTEIDSRANDSQIASFGCLEPSWVFYSEGPIREFGYGSLSTGTQQGSFDQFLQNTPDPLIITTDEHWAKIESQLPSDVRPLLRTPYFLRQGRQLILLGRRDRNSRNSSTHTAHDTSTDAARGDHDKLRR